MAAEKTVKTLGGYFILPHPVFKEFKEFGKVNAIFHFQNGSRPLLWILKLVLGILVFHILRFFNFQDGGRPPSWICLGHIWITYELRMVFGGLYHCSKFGCNSMKYSFDNMKG